MPRVAVMISGTGTLLQSLIDVRPRSLWSLDRESVNPPADADVYSEEAERQV